MHGVIFYLFSVQIFGEDWGGNIRGPRIDPQNKVFRQTKCIYLYMCMVKVVITDDDRQAPSGGPRPPLCKPVSEKVLHLFLLKSC